MLGCIKQQQSIIPNINKVRLIFLSYNTVYGAITNIFAIESIKGKKQMIIADNTTSTMLNLASVIHPNAKLIAKRILIW